MRTINPNTPLAKILALDAGTDSFNGTYGFSSEIPAEDRIALAEGKNS
jgi:hypothetical protein